MVWPTMKLAAGLQSHTTAAAISSGHQSDRWALAPPSAQDFRVVIFVTKTAIGVSTTPGQTALMGMPLAA
jgi:hypothetical protein